jgi:ATP-dependent DNA ligase
MLTTLKAAASTVPGRIYEEKYDGWRMLAIKEAGVVRLISRNGREHTRRFADLVAARG